MDLKIDDGLKALLEIGKRKGFLTYAQIKTHIPDDSSDSGRLDQVLQLLEENGIELIEESEADERDPDSPAEAVEEAPRQWPGQQGTRPQEAGDQTDLSRRAAALLQIDWEQEEERPRRAEEERRGVRLAEGVVEAM